MMSPSERSNGRPPMQTQAVSSNSRCHDADGGLLSIISVDLLDKGSSVTHIASSSSRLFSACICRILFITTKGSCSVTSFPPTSRKTCFYTVATARSIVIPGWLRKLRNSETAPVCLLSRNRVHCCSWLSGRIEPCSGYGTVCANSAVRCPLCPTSYHSNLV